MKVTIAKKLVAGFGLAIFILITISTISYISTSKLIEANDRARHTHEVLEHTAYILTVLDDAETGQRGFIITGQERYLEPYYLALKRINKEIESAKKLTQDNINQQVRFDRLNLLVVAKLEELKKND